MVPPSLIVGLGMLGTYASFGEGRADAVYLGSWDETPLPADVSRPLTEVPTGQELFSPVESLVLQAADLQQRLAFLPIDPEHERRVEKYIQAHAPARGGRRLTRRG